MTPGAAHFSSSGFSIAEHINQAAAFAGLQGDVDLMHADRGPAVCHRVGAGALFDDLRVGVAAPGAQERIAAGVKAIHRRVDGVQRVVVAALTVLGFVVDRAALDLDLAGRKIALEVGGIIHGVPQAELYVAENGKRFRFLTLVGQHQAVDLAVVTHGDEQLQFGSQAVLFPGQYAVAQAVAALVKIQLGLGGLPAGIPDGFAVFNIVVTAVRIRRYVIITVAGDAPQLGVLVKAVAARSVGYQAEECLAAQVVDPWQRRARGGDDVLTCGVSEMNEHHRDPLLNKWKPIER